MAGKPWSDTEIQFLREHFVNLACREIAIQLGRTTKAVQHMFGILGLERPEPKVGDKFERLTILEFYNVFRYGQNRTMVKCVCECGNIHRTYLTALKRGKVKSCKCLMKEKVRDRIILQSTTHGMSNTRLHRIWKAMKTRCYNPNSIEYDAYGGRGINICDRWIDDFKTFYDWAISHGYDDNLSIDRIDNDQGYSPDNCRWATAKEQARNRQSTVKTMVTAFGETKWIHHWLDDPRCKVKSIGVIAYRLGAGWEPERAITQHSERH